MYLKASSPNLRMDGQIYSNPPRAVSRYFSNSSDQQSVLALPYVTEADVRIWRVPLKIRNITFSDSDVGCDKHIVISGQHRPMKNQEYHFFCLLQTYTSTQMANTFLKMRKRVSRKTRVLYYGNMQPIVKGLTNGYHMQIFQLSSNLMSRLCLVLAVDLSTAPTTVSESKCKSYRDKNAEKD